jgi:apurinic endonuclease APN1
MTLVFGAHTQNSIEGLGFNCLTNQKSKVNIKIAAQIFFGSPIKWNKENLSKFNDDFCFNIKKFIQKNNVFLVIHGQYLINFIKPSNISYLSRNSLVNDIVILNKITQDSGVVIHMGKNIDKLPINNCIINFGENLQKVIEKTKNLGNKIILETSTKTKNGNDIFHDISILGKLDSHLIKILSKETYSKRIGYCIDTCHVFASGYNISTQKGFESFINIWDHYIGPNKITLFHLNDSKAGVGCCLDRHQELTKGEIFKQRQDGLKALLDYAKKNSIPVISETGGDQTFEINLVDKLINP